MKRIFLLLACLPVWSGLQAQSLSALKDSCYSYLKQNDRLSFNETYIKLLDAYAKEADPEYYPLEQELCAMRKKDQSIRLLLMDAEKKYGKDETLPQSIRHIMNEIDSVNASRVIQIIDKYGWLGADDIGEEANEAIFLCIQHYNDTIIQNKYLPILKEAVANGNAKGWHYAFLTDRCLMNQGKPQVYGTQTIRAKGKYYLVPLQDVDRVDELRKEVGLQPLSQYMDDFNEEWSEEIYKKELPTNQTVFHDWYNKRK